VPAAANCSDDTACAAAELCTTSRCELGRDRLARLCITRENVLDAPDRKSALTFFTPRPPQKFQDWPHALDSTWLYLRLPCPVRLQAEPQPPGNCHTQCGMNWETRNSLLATILRSRKCAERVIRSRPAGRIA